MIKNFSAIYRRLRKIGLTKISLTKIQKWLLIALVIVWFSHAIQVLVPETGFDAVWYHLPLVKMISENHGLVYDPDLYQSLNPQVGELIYLPGYLLSGELGTKITAYILGLILIWVFYKLCRLYLNRTYALSTLILVSTFQVISWQSSSFYVDTVNALFMLLALYFLLMWQQNKVTFKKINRIYLSAIFLGLALSTKQYAITMLPAYLIIISFHPQRLKSMLKFACIAFIVSLFWYARSYFYSHHLIFSIQTHIYDLIAPNGWGVLGYFVRKICLFPLSFIQIGWVRDYTSPLLWLLWPTIIYLSQKQKLSRPIWFLIIFVLFSWLTWWLVPPLSTRYALAGFMVAALVVVYGLSIWAGSNRLKTNTIMGLLLFFALINFLPRLLVNLRSLQYLLGRQTKAEYISQFFDGNSDSVLKKWHHFP